MGRKVVPDSKMVFKPGDFVFAKLKGYSPWPAKVDSNLGEVFPRKYKVFFYGTSQTAYLTEKDIFPYEEFKTKFESRNKSFDYVKAISELEYAQSNKSASKSPILDDGSKTPQFPCSEDETEQKSPPSVLPNQVKPKKSKSASKISKKGNKVADSAKLPNNCTISAMKRKLSSDKSLKNISKIPKLSRAEISEEDVMKQFDSDIKNSLSVSDPNIENCADILNRALAHEFTVNSLIKYPELITTLKKVRKYKGSQEVRDLADKVLIKLKGTCRSLRSFEFDRIFQINRVIAKKPDPPRSEEHVPPPKSVNVPELTLSEKLAEAEKKNRIRIEETIAQIMRESTINLPKYVVNSNKDDTETSHLVNAGDFTSGGIGRSRIDDFDVYANDINDEDILNMLGV